MADFKITMDQLRAALDATYRRAEVLRAQLAAKHARFELMADANPEYVPSHSEVVDAEPLLFSAWGNAIECCDLSAGDTRGMREALIVDLRKAAAKLGCDLIPTTPGQVRE